MYRRPKFLEVLDEIRAEMSCEVDYDVDLFAEKIRHAQDLRKTENDGGPENAPLRALVIDEIATTKNHPTKIKK